MTNTNCLEGMRCPKCGSHAPFRIAIKVVVLMHDDGFDNDTLSDTAWGPDSYCQCEQCGFTGEVLALRLGAKFYGIE